jgi:hypothetical protein
MVEWHLTPKYILEEMTDEEFALMWDKRNERVIATQRAIDQLRDSDAPPRAPAGPAERVTAMDMFDMMGIKEAQA